MIKIVALIALMIIVLVALLRFVAGKSRARDRYIRCDYEKYKRLDEQLERGTDVFERQKPGCYPGRMP